VHSMPGDSHLPTGKTVEYLDYWSEGASIRRRPTTLTSSANMLRSPFWCPRKCRRDYMPGTPFGSQTHRPSSTFPTSTRVGSRGSPLRSAPAATALTPTLERRERASGSVRTSRVTSLSINPSSAGPSCGGTRPELTWPSPGPTLLRRTLSGSRIRCPRTLPRLRAHRTGQSPMKAVTVRVYRNPPRSDMY